MSVGWKDAQTNCMVHNDIIQTSSLSSSFVAVGNLINTVGVALPMLVTIPTQHPGRGGNVQELVAITEQEH